MVKNYYTSIELIKDNITIVEIDESKFGKRKYHRGHHVKSILVLGIAERTEQRKIILLTVDNRAKEV